MVFGFLTRSAPRYLGVDGRPQAPSSQGALAFLSGMLGGSSTPVYAGDGQPPAGSTGFGVRLVPSTPRYLLPAVEPAADGAGDAEVTASREVVIVTLDAKACASAVLQRLQDRVFEND